MLGEPVLREVAKPVDLEMEGLQQFVDDMIETMVVARGVGIAAPQVGRSLRMFIALDADGMPMTFINPEISYLSKRFVKLSEGCLSIPGRRADVSRPETVKLSWTDRLLQKREKLFFGRDARVILHEFDHIEGKLFIDLIENV